MATQALGGEIDERTQVCGDVAAAGVDQVDGNWRWLVLGKDDEALAGIMDDKNKPSHWAVYFQVESVDDAVAKTVELGGKVDSPPTDTRYGRLAECTDPTGAPFRLMG